MKVKYPHSEAHNHFLDLFTSTSNRELSLTGPSSTTKPSIAISTPSPVVRIARAKLRFRVSLIGDRCTRHSHVNRGSVKTRPCVPPKFEFFFVNFEVQRSFLDKNKRGVRNPPGERFITYKSFYRVSLRQDLEESLRGKQVKIERRKRKLVFPEIPQIQVVF